ncbi:hypothetical protein ACHAXR_008197 [Thalassiosira sp. AJA248-18]
MRASKTRISLLASALVILILAITTIFSTRLEAGRLRSNFSDVATNYKSLVTSFPSFNLSDIIGTASSSDDIPVEDLNDDDQINRTDEMNRGNVKGDEIVSTEKIFQSDSDEPSLLLDQDGNKASLYDGIEKAILNVEEDALILLDNINISSRVGSILENITKTSNSNAGAISSPACHPHFNLVLPHNKWNNTTKFKRIYFYHARKAGGSTVHRYLSKVAQHHGLELKATEWTAMEEPGTYDDGATFYISHLREPVDRSISHFKYQGRWDCKDLSRKERKFIPSENNANKLETWNQTGGHKPFECKTKGSKKKGGLRPFFFLGQCAVNCYAQWFSGLSCAKWGISPYQQYQVATAKVMKYNFLIVIEKLSDPNYVRAVEDFFGVPGLTEKGSPFCEKQSHKANAKIPLIVHDDTRARLTRLNELDIQLYHDVTDCLDSIGSQYNFPKWNPNRFQLHTYNMTEVKAAEMRAKAKKNSNSTKR